MREPLGNQSCVKYTFVPNASGDHPITIFDLAGINVVDLFAAVLLADPPSRAVVMDGPFIRSTYLRNCQSGLIRIVPDDISLPAALLRHLIRLFHLLLSERSLD